MARAAASDKDRTSASLVPYSLCYMYSVLSRLVVRSCFFFLFVNRERKFDFSLKRARDLPRDFIRIFTSHVFSTGFFRKIRSSESLPTGTRKSDVRLSRDIDIGEMKIQFVRVRADDCAVGK